MTETRRAKLGDKVVPVELTVNGRICKLRKTGWI